jgi:hypothetical protein
MKSETRLLLLRSAGFGRLELELGRHHHGIARELGYADMEIAELAQQGVFR